MNLRPRLVRPGRRVVTVAAAAAVVLAGGTAGLALADGGPDVPPAHPTSADQIQNIDQVRTAIKAYYGDTADTTTVDPVTGQKDLHTFSATGAYATEVSGIAASAKKYLAAPDPRGSYPVNPGRKAVLFDVDDTLLSTYSYEIYSNFVYNPTSNAAFVNSGVFPAVPGMVGLENYARSKGYTVFFLTGRPGTQRDGTVANLRGAGYHVDSANLYLKDYAADTWLSSCAPSCSTIQYKSLTRAHIEAAGYRIVANFGDQYSDLTGGHADRTFKLPNPMYYLP